MPVFHFAWEMLTVNRILGCRHSYVRFSDHVTIDTMVKSQLYQLIRCIFISRGQVDLGHHMETHEPKVRPVGNIRPSDRYQFSQPRPDDVLNWVASSHLYSSLVCRGYIKMLENIVDRQRKADLSCLTCSGFKFCHLPTSRSIHDWTKRRVAAPWSFFNQAVSGGGTARKQISSNVLRRKWYTFSKTVV